MAKPKPETNSRVLSPQELIEWASKPTPTYRARTYEDAIPGGLSAANVPILVNWRESEIDDRNAPGAHYLVRNVCVNSNPVEGITTLATIRVPCRGVTAADYISVPFEMLGSKKLGAHGMVRLTFHEKARPVVLKPDGEPYDGDSELRDLVFSWEAWTPPHRRFKLKKGLDPTQFALTMRCYSGAQRFLEDAIRKRNWRAYPLDLPSPENTLDELLYINLVMGDSIGRHTISWLFREYKEAMQATRAMRADFPMSLDEGLDELQDAIKENSPPENPIEEVFEGETSYQLIERSCVSMSLQSISVAVERATSHLPAEHRVTFSPAPRAPKWIKDLAHADLAGIFLRMPMALWWIARNYTVIPGRAYQILDQAGLLRRDALGPVSEDYSFTGTNPYGRRTSHLK